MAYESDVFISYKREEQHFALELKSRLEANGHIVWLDKELDYGTEWRETIDMHLENTILVLVIAEPRSMMSPFVTYEWCYACKARGKDFHWIQIADFDDKKNGMFGYLTSRRQEPLKVSSNTPSEDEWTKVIKSVDKRLVGIKSIREDGRILQDLHIGVDPQIAAAERLGKVDNPFHKPLARQILLKGLKAHTRTTGKVSRPIVRSLDNIGGDLSAIPYLIGFLKEGHEKDIDDLAKYLLDGLVAQYG